MQNIYLKKPWATSYPKEVPVNVDVPPISIPDAFDETVKRWGKEKTSIIFYGERVSYGFLKEQVDTFATALWDLGVRKGDRVIIYLVNSPQSVIAILGALKIGAIVSPMSPAYVVPEVKQRLDDTGANTIICQDVLYNRVKQTGVLLKNIIVTSIDEYLPQRREKLAQKVLPSIYDDMTSPPLSVFESDGVYSFQGLLKKYLPNPPTVELDAKNDIAILPYTGGTTGIPKGAMLTHYNVMAVVTQDAAFCHYLDDGKEVVLAFQPFSHIAGLIMRMLRPIILGYTNVILSNPNLDDILSSINDYGVTYFSGGPSVYKAILGHDKMDTIDWKKFKAAGAGNDIFPTKTAQQWIERTGKTPLESWGMTEFGIATSVPMKTSKKGSIGIPQPNVTAAIFSVETGKSLPFDEVGEVYLSGPPMMKGYWNQPDETDRAIVEIDGVRWFKTGDLARMDHDGYLFFYGRNKFLIKHKGYGIFPPEIEAVLTSHLVVSEAAVVGIPNSHTGENVHAVLVLQEGFESQRFEQDILDHCRQNLTHVKVPTSVEFRNSLPKTQIGKVDRKRLVDEYSDSACPES